MRLIKKVFIIVFIIIIISLVIIILINNKVMPIYMNYAESEMERVVTTVINKSVLECKINDDMFIIKNVNSNTIVDYDPMIINKIMSDISNKVYDNLKKVGDQDEEILKKYNLDKNLKINLNNINENLEKIEKSKFIDELKPERFGDKLLKEIKINDEITISQLISWTHFISNALKLIKNAKNYFDEIILTEYIDNNFLFKIKKTDNNKSIGFLFGLFEEGKDDCYITEYSIQQTSLEQIFNNFAAHQIKEGIDDTIDIKKLEIPITDEVINNLIN